MRTVRWVSTAFLVMPVVLGSAQSAAGGGAVLDFKRFYSPGEVAAGSTDVWTGALGTGDVDDGPYHAYLLPSGRFIRPPRIPANAIPIGPIQITGTSGLKYVEASLTFTVPEVPPGDYSVSFCNDPCTEAFVGDLVGGWFSVAATPEEARLASLRERLERRLAAAKQRIRVADRQIELLRGETEVRIEDVTRRLGRMRNALADVRPSQDGGPGVGTWAGWAVAVLVALAAFGRWRRSRPEPAATPPLDEPLQDERELVTAGRP